jgi:hypothetical protein
MMVELADIKSKRLLVAWFEGVGGGSPLRREEAAWQQGSLFLGRTVPTEAKPSELSGEILCLAV